MTNLPALPPDAAEERALLASLFENQGKLSQLEHSNAEIVAKLLDSPLLNDEARNHLRILVTALRVQADAATAGRSVFIEEIGKALSGTKRKRVTGQKWKALG